MQSIQSNPKAEDSYRAAFLRLKSNRPIRMPVGTVVSQNNVAKEAGVDPSALRKSRFPSLIAEIQHYVAESCSHHVSARQEMLARRKIARTLKERLTDAIEQRDKLTGLLNDANARIVVLAAQVSQLQAMFPRSEVILLRGNTKKIED